jgi:hypothetical protein
LITWRPTVKSAADIGLRVRVPFGRQFEDRCHRRIAGKHSDFAPEQLKPVEAVLRDLPRCRPTGSA